MIEDIFSPGGFSWLIVIKRNEAARDKISQSLIYTHNKLLALTHNNKKHSLKNRTFEIIISTSVSDKTLATQNVQSCIVFKCGDKGEVLQCGKADEPAEATKVPEGSEQDVTHKTNPRSPNKEALIIPTLEKAFYLVRSGSFSRDHLFSCFHHRQNSRFIYHIVSCSSL